MAARRTWTDEELRVAIADSGTVTEAIFALGLSSPSSSYSTITYHVARLGLDTSHFKGQGWRRGARKRPDEVRTALEPLLRRGGKKVANLQNRLLSSGLKKAACEECGLEEWRGKAAPLQIDHVDGDNLNNAVENLRILCANCHVQTETWGFKGSRRRPVQNPRNPE